MEKGVMMTEMVQRLIEELKDKVRVNLLEIQSNQKEIRELLKQQVSPERTQKLEEKYAFNRQLLAENNDFINVQLTLTNFIEKYSNTNIFAENTKNIVPLSKDECFEMTISNKMEFNKKHPYFDDDAFFQRILDYFKSVEDYEKCGKLVEEQHKKMG
jgi:hypothetical protein